MDRAQEDHHARARQGDEPLFFVPPVTKGVTAVETSITAVTIPRDGSWSCFSSPHARDGDVLVLYVWGLILTPVTRTRDHPWMVFSSSHGRDGVCVVVVVLVHGRDGRVGAPHAPCSCP